MRIIAGTAKGRVLKSQRGQTLRPTGDRMRESVFGVLGPRVRGARFLDLYAGVGTMGLEALSRGASEAVFVESHRPAGRMIEENVRRCGFEGRARVLAMAVARAVSVLRREGAPFDIVFADPPYERGEVGAAVARLTQWPELVAEDGILLIQHSRHEEPPASDTFEGMRRLRFGETIVDLYQRSAGHGSTRNDEDGG